MGCSKHFFLCKLDKSALLDEMIQFSFTRRSYGAFLRSNETALHASFFLKRPLRFSWDSNCFKRKEPRPRFEPTTSSKLVLTKRALTPKTTVPWPKDQYLYDIKLVNNTINTNHFLGKSETKFKPNKNMSRYYKFT